MKQKQEARAEQVFPFLDEDERQTVLQFAQALEREQEGSQPSKEAFEAFMRMIRRFYEGFFCSPMNASLRQHFRSKLLNISGIYTLISPQEIFQYVQAKRDEKIRQRAVLAKSIFAENLEIQAKELSQFKELKLLLLLKDDEGKSFFDYCTEHADFVVFRKNLDLELYSSIPVSASSEALSRSILVQNCIQHDEFFRDEFSISFDIVYQAAVLEFFYRAKLCVHAIDCERAARKKALFFAKEAKELFKKHAKIDSQFLLYLDDLISKNQERIEQIS